MARVTVEDCVDKVDSPYELVLVAKERTAQLNTGVEPSVSIDNDKNTVISLREIANENVKVSDLIDSAVYKLRKHVEQADDNLSEDDEVGDDFENLYKGEISKSGTPILPSKRARKIPEKIQAFSKEDIAESSPSQPTELVETPTEQIETPTEQIETLSDSKNEEVSIEEIKDKETTEENSEV